MTRITVLSKRDCHLCDHAKATLERIAPELGLEVEVIDLASERGRSLAAGAGIPFPPAILMDGAPFANGRLSEPMLRRELARRRGVPVG